MTQTKQQTTGKFHYYHSLAKYSKKILFNRIYSYVEKHDLFAKHKCRKIINRLYNMQYL